MSCPEWVFDAKDCPAIPDCESYNSCGQCAALDDCTWCPSIEKCLRNDLIVDYECSSAVFDLPCPTSYVEKREIVGDLIVKADPTFGGGSLEVTGVTDDKRTFSMKANSDGFEVDSADEVSIKAGDRSAINEAGASTIIKAGDGTNPDRGAGGNIDIEAGKFTL
eukprot:TRINITY_DN3751_c0_g1_i2.p1 TRINITY_DN3751_c0_g1~~TRINITY_DN3751_c0_g1_i2.p1  ORF type:complete len:164 (-),score=56.73 TRINITY_DN3751_c0_g1_i2:118-609(-)